MKKFDLKSIALGLAICTVGITTVFAANGIKSAAFNSSKINFYGQEVPLQNQLVSIVKDGDTIPQMYMPVRELLEYMNFIVEWNEKDSSINLTMKEDTKIGKNVRNINNNGVEYYNYVSSEISQSEADDKGIAIMSSSGTWGSQIDALLPYMTPTGVEKVVTIYLDRHLFQGITTPQAAEQVASTIDGALKYMTEDAKKVALERISAYSAESNQNNNVSTPENITQTTPNNNQVNNSSSTNNYVGTDGVAWSNNCIQTVGNTVVWFNNESPDLLTQEEAGQRAVHIMQNTGTWKMIEAYLPYMSNTDIVRMVDIYNSKRPASQHKNASDYTL